MLILFIVAPVLVISENKKTMLDSYFILLSFSRYFRIIYFFSVLMKHHEYAQTDLDRKFKQNIVILVIVVILSSGVFGEMMNFEYLTKIENGKMIFDDDY